jgi:hypothetical protein
MNVHYFLLALLLVGWTEGGWAFKFLFLRFTGVLLLLLDDGVIGFLLLFLALPC